MSRLAKQVALLAVALCFITGCEPSVTITATRSPTFVGRLEPVTFIIFEGNTGPKYTEPLRKDLFSELRQRQIAGRAIIITGAEFNEERILDQVASQSKGVILIIPAGGTSYYGTLKQILYNVRVFEIREGKTATSVWRARVDTNSGAYESQIEDRLALFAKDLVDQLVGARILPYRKVKDQ
jgi:hypothetical protein